MLKLVKMLGRDAVIAAVLLASLSPLSAASSQRAWTVMVYVMAYTDQQELDWAKYAFDSLHKLGGSKEVCVLVESLEHDQSLDPATARITRHVIGDQEESASWPVPSYSVEDMTSETVLKDFVSWGLSEFPAHRYMLLLYSHSQGWRSCQPYVAIGESDGDDVHRVNHLHVRGFADVLRDTLDGEHRIDLIVTDACMMGMLEVAYELRDLCDVLVASEEIDFGLSYERWPTNLRQDPAQNAEQLASIIVDDYQDTYGPNSSFSITSATLAAICTEEIPDLAIAVTDLADIMVATLPDTLPAVQSARNNCGRYGEEWGNYHGVDLKRLCDQLAAHSNSADLTRAAQRVSHLVENAVLASYSGPDRDEKTTFGSAGIAIYFPATRADFDDDEHHPAYEQGNQDHPVTFVVNERWDEFLKEYHNCLGR